MATSLSRVTRVSWPQRRLTSPSNPNFKRHTDPPAAHPHSTCSSLSSSPHPLSSSRQGTPTSPHGDHAKPIMIQMLRLSTIRPSQSRCRVSAVTHSDPPKPHRRRPPAKWAAPHYMRTPAVDPLAAVATVHCGQEALLRLPGRQRQTCLACRSRLGMPQR